MTAAAAVSGLSMPLNSFGPGLGLGLRGVEEGVGSWEVGSGRPVVVLATGGTTSLMLLLLLVLLSFMLLSVVVVVAVVVGVGLAAMVSVMTLLFSALRANRRCAVVIITVVGGVTVEVGVAGAVVVVTEVGGATVEVGVVVDVTMPSFLSPSTSLMRISSLLSSLSSKSVLVVEMGVVFVSVGTVVLGDGGDDNGDDGGDDNGDVGGDDNGDVGGDDNGDDGGDDNGDADGGDDNGDDGGDDNGDVGGDDNGDDDGFFLVGDDNA